MGKRVISLAGSKKEFFKMYLTSTKYMYEVSLTQTNKEKTTITDQEADFLALILFYNDKYKSIEMEDRMAFILSTESKIKIRKELGVSSNRLDVMMSELKRKGIVSKQTGLDKRFEYYLDNSQIQETVFKFKILKDEDNSES